MSENPIASSTPARALAFLFVAATLLAAGWMRAAALDPPSLWLDDVWVAFLTKHARAGELLTYGATVPMGFVAALQGFAWFVPDPEWGLQLFPYLCGLAVLPAAAGLSHRLGSSALFSAATAALLAFNPFAVRYFVRVKQYASDALVCTLLFWAASGLLTTDRVRIGRLAAYIASSWAAMCLSYVSLLVSLPAVHLAAAAAWVSGTDRGRRWLPSALALVFDAGVLIYYLERLRYQARPALGAYWKGSFLPLDSPLSTFQFLVDRVPTTFAAAFPDGLSVLVLLVPLGLVFGLATRATRPIGLLWLAVMLAWPVASALGVYPYGGGRTDQIFFPLIVAMAVLGAERTMVAGRVAPLVAVALVIAGVAAAEESRYPHVRDRQLVERVSGLLGADDAMVVHWNARYQFGYYSEIPIHTRMSRSRKEKFSYRTRRPGVLFAENRSSPLAAGLLDGYRRFLYLEAFSPYYVRTRQRELYDTFAEGGFVPTQEYSAPDGRLVVYTRTSGQVGSKGRETR